VRGAPDESAKVKSSATAPTRSFCPSFKGLIPFDETFAVSSLKPAVALPA